MFSILFQHKGAIFPRYGKKSELHHGIVRRAHLLASIIHKRPAIHRDMSDLPTIITASDCVQSNSDDAALRIISTKNLSGRSKKIKHKNPSTF